MKEYLSCPICLDYCIFPVLTECGHHYCLPCFEQAHRTSDSCCVCRASIDTVDFEPSENLKNLFERYVRTQLDWAEAELYSSMQNEFLRRDSTRKLYEVIRTGQMLDFRIKKSLWVEAKVISIEGKHLEI